MVHLLLRFNGFLRLVFLVCIFGRFLKSMNASGYKQSDSDHTFLKPKYSKVALVVYFDYMLVTGRNDLVEKKKLKVFF